MDNIDVIGGTTQTGRNREEKLWNKYYFLHYQHVVDCMLKDEKNGSILDVGTSHGVWFDFFKKRGFIDIYGVEISSDRAAQARRRGYTEVENCDAMKTSFADESFDVACSNDVFVHILQMADKSSVLQEVFRVLKPDGVFIISFALGKPHGYNSYHVLNHCSFNSLDEILRLISDSTQFKIEDIQPTMYFYRDRNSKLLKIRRLALKLIPLIGPRVIYFIDKRMKSRGTPLESSDVIYVKLRKSMNQ